MNEGYVYLIGTPIFGWYKIGKSRTPEVRVKDLGILLPFKVEIIGVWKAVNHHLMESTLHDIHKSNRINGEWFAFTRKEAYNVYASIPEASRIYPADNKEHPLDRFSNVEEDRKDSKKVIGVRTQKLRGNFTPEEREAKRLESMAKHSEKKRLQQNQKEIKRTSGFSRIGLNNI